MVIVSSAKAGAAEPMAAAPTASGKQKGKQSEMRENRFIVVPP
jgi:hypothetical protein